MDPFAGAMNELMRQHSPRRNNGSTPLDGVLEQMHQDAFNGARGPREYTLPGVRMLDARPGHSARELPTLYANGRSVGFVHGMGGGALAFVSGSIPPNGTADVTINGHFENLRFYIDGIDLP